jgi:signal transduction histidine kinase
MASLIPILSLVSLALGLLGLGAALLARRGCAAAEDRARVAEARAKAQSRALGLAAAELRSRGLGLLGHAAAADSHGMGADGSGAPRAADGSGALRAADGSGALRAADGSGALRAADGSGALRAADGSGALRAHAEALLHLADDICDSASAQAGPRHIREAPVVMAPLLDQVLAGVDGQLAPGRRHWRIEPALRGLSLQADPRALSGILTALLQRLARETQEGETVALRLVPAPDTVAIAVEAAGAGLPAGDLAPDADALGSDTPGADSRAGAAPGALAAAAGTRGLGLGLSVARALAQAHGGELALEATPGIGLRAWLVLPRARMLAAA